MADPFVPVHLAINWFIVNSSSLNRGASPLTVDEACRRPRGEQSDRPGYTEEEETPVSATLLGYEILKERDKFTLRELFPGFHQALPPKRRFKDNYDGSFLEKRRFGLQTFLENLMLHKDISTSEPVRYFLSMDDPSSPFYSMEESRAFRETLEQKNHRLLRELLEKQREADSLTKSLEDKENYIDLLWRKGRALNDPDLEFHLHKKEDTNLKLREKPVPPEGRWKLFSLRNKWLASSGGSEVGATNRQRPCPDCRDEYSVIAA
ncbi:hypothetical protein CCH79_00011234 [Gambusia affinis]|uniref:PX domain-containing protein n=1 Tax=Gambusia affinis TaxID=33528 RepID=A0A315V2Y5_GAMAF|nr:hypothetical protein CCH79_00011234 [Gambusia affinis]